MTNNPNDDHLMTINQFQQVQKQYYRQQYQNQQRPQIYDYSIDHNQTQVMPFSPFRAPPNLADISYRPPLFPAGQPPTQAIPLVQPQTLQSLPTFRLNNDTNETQDQNRQNPDQVEIAENQQQIHKVHRIFPELPSEIKSVVSHRASKNEETRFPHKLFKLLEWSGHHQNRQEIAGCGWISEDEFFLDKSFICHHFGIKLNTLNSNLKNLGFVQSRKRQNDRTFFKNTSSTFKNVSQDHDLLTIRHDHDTVVALQRAFNMPLLADLELYGLSHDDVFQFKKNAILAWESIIGVMKFAIGISEFLKILQTQFLQMTDVEFVREALSPRVPTVIDIFDFAVFLARFGPFENLIAKIGQYQQFFRFLRSDLSFWGSLSPASFYGTSFNNGFSFKLEHVGEYHCYNLPLKTINQTFLVDEDNQYFSQWYHIYRIYPSLARTS